MPKIKTLKSLKKRVKVTAKGKIKCHHAGKSHILTKKTRKRKRALRKDGIMSKVDADRVKKLLPYE